MRTPKRTISALQRNQSSRTSPRVVSREPAIAQPIGLSPLYPARPSDLQISNGSILHPTFVGLNWPGIDRRSGPPPLTPSEHTSSLTVNCCGLVGFLRTYINLNLANDQDSWGIFQTHATPLISSLSRLFSLYPSVSRSFHIPLRILSAFTTLLVNYRSSILRIGFLPPVFTRDIQAFS